MLWSGLSKCYHMRKLLVLLLLGFFTASLSANPVVADENDDGQPDQWLETHDGIIIKMSLDRNFDSMVDYRVEFDDSGRRIFEEGDFNFDGKMDDFYFFEDGLLIRQEIDSNFDERIDIWVYLDEGAYIRKYERDLDFDGSVDSVIDYTEH